jgi:hypothetical protein
MRAVYAFTVCIRDDDAKAFEFRRVNDTKDLMSRVAAGVAEGRNVRCYALAADEQAREREEKYLAGKGYTQAVVRV